MCIIHTRAERPKGTAGSDFALPGAGVTHPHEALLLPDNTNQVAFIHEKAQHPASI